MASLATAIAYGGGRQHGDHRRPTLGTLLAIIALLAQMYAPDGAVQCPGRCHDGAGVLRPRLRSPRPKPMVADAPDATRLPRHPTAGPVRSGRVPYPAPTRSRWRRWVRRPDPRRSGPSGPGAARRHVRGARGRDGGAGRPSGAGKTTITGLVTRLYDPTSGSVSIAGHDLRDVTQSRSMQQSGS